MTLFRRPLFRHEALAALIAAPAPEKLPVERMGHARTQPGDRARLVLGKPGVSPWQERAMRILKRGA